MRISDWSSDVCSSDLFDLNLGDSCKPDFFDSADLNSGEPDVVPGGESFYVFECRTKRYAFYKGFLLATQNKNPRYQDDDTDGYEYTNDDRSFIICLLHVFYSVKL